MASGEVRDDRALCGIDQVPEDDEGSGETDGVAGQRCAGNGCSGALLELPERIGGTLWHPGRRRRRPIVGLPRSGFGRSGFGLGLRHGVTRRHPGLGLGRRHGVTRRHPGLGLGRRHGVGPRRPALGQRPGVGHQRLAQAEIDVHRPRVVARASPHGAGLRGPVSLGVDCHRSRGCGRGIRPTDDRPDRAGVAPLPRRLDVDLPPHRPPEDPGLDGGLVRPRVAQLPWPVRGDDDQRDAPVMRLQHRGVEVGDRSPRGRDDERGTPGHLGQPERQKGGRAFVDPDVEAHEAGVGGSERGIREWCRPRPGTQDDLAHTAGHSLRDERTGEIDCGGRHAPIMPKGRFVARCPRARAEGTR